MTASQFGTVTDVGRVGLLPKGQKICLCSETSEPAVVPTQPHIQCVPRLKRPGRNAECLHLLQGLIRGPVCQFRLTHSWRGAKLTHQLPVATIRTARLTFTNSPFCPHNVFMCFVWMWAQTAIISLHNVSWLVCITETECVYCVVRTGSVYIIQVNFSV